MNNTQTNLESDLNDVNVTNNIADLIADLPNDDTSLNSGDITDPNWDTNSWHDNSSDSVDIADEFDDSDDSIAIPASSKRRRPKWLKSPLTGLSSRLPTLSKSSSKPESKSASKPSSILGSKQSKQPSPTPKRSLPKLLIWAIIGLILLIVAVLIVKQLQSQFASSSSAGATAVPALESGADNNQSTADNSPNNVTASTNTNDSALGEAEPPIDASANTPNLPNPLDNIPSQQEILSAPIPDSDALIKEEIQRLQDEYARLQTQEDSIKEQLEVLDKINLKKEEQIALFEQRLALMQNSD